MSLRPASKQKGKSAVSSEVNQPQFAEIEDHPLENPFLLDDVGESGSELDEDTAEQEDKILAWLEDDFHNESIDDVPEFQVSELPSSSSSVQQPSSSSGNQAQALVSETAASAHPPVSKPRTFTEKPLQIPGVGEIHICTQIRTIW